MAGTEKTSSSEATKLTRGQWVNLFCVGSVHFACAICVSIQAPFYPKEAESKGVSATEHGLVFGIFELVSFLVSPLLGKYMDKMGPKTVLNIGMFIAGVCCMLFGLLDLLDGHIIFISLSFLIRIIESMGASAATVAAFAITAEMFPDKVAVTFATLEIFYGMGYIVGPMIGGLLFSVSITVFNILQLKSDISAQSVARPPNELKRLVQLPAWPKSLSLGAEGFLYTLGGYKLPFLVMGGTLALDCLLIYLLLPKLGGNADPRPQGKLMAILSVPAVLLDTFSIMSTAMSMGFYSATLEPHLRQFDLGPVMMGVMFVLSGAMYTITAPLVGRLCDTRVYPKKFISIGSALIIISYLLVGPFPYLPIEPRAPVRSVSPDITLTETGLVDPYTGTSLNTQLSASRAKGFPDDMTTYGIISGLWLSSFSLGAFIGPSVAGLLYDLVYFRKSTLFIITLHVIVLLLSVGFVCIEKRPKAQQTATHDNLGEAQSMLQLDDDLVPTIVRRKSGVDVEMTTLASNNRKL
uniref:Major facilitator superfamily (MFS) profile domain-containing protein n=1 Tax=Timema poppense TaxID=170557 RepID=A0A7R9D1V5_TIMPO|nr:unnamed protein product [Timema poppensis]